MMGAQLVSRVYASWAHVPDRPFRLLAHMALTVKDATEKPTYWGGRDAMCQALGLSVGTESSHAVIKRALKKLADEGAIRRVMDGHAGKRSEYLLTLERGNSGVPLRGNANDPLRGNSGVPQRGNSGVPAGVTQAYPQGTTVGGSEENREEENLVGTRPSVGRSHRVAKARNSRLDLVRARADAEAAS